MERNAQLTPGTRYWTISATNRARVIEERNMKARTLALVALGLSVLFFSGRRRHTSLQGDWSSDVCSSDLGAGPPVDRPYVVADHVLAQRVELRALAPAPGDDHPVDDPQPGQLLRQQPARGEPGQQIGRASCRERV